MSDKYSKKAASSNYVATHRNSLQRLKRKLDSIDSEFNSRGKQVITVVKSGKSNKKAT